MVKLQYSRRFAWSSSQDTEVEEEFLDNYILAAPAAAGAGQQDLATGGKDAWHWPGCCWLLLAAAGCCWASALSRHWPNVRGKDDPSLFQNYNSLLQITMMDWRNVAGAAAWSAPHQPGRDIGCRNSGKMLKCNNNRHLSWSHYFDQILSKIVPVCMIEI